MNNTKEYSLQLQHAAQQLLELEHVDINEPVNVRLLAKRLALSTGCHYDTAKQHIMKAVLRLRGEVVHASWGGTRPGSGQPRKEDG